MNSSEGETWKSKHGRYSEFLLCRKRYSMPLIVEFRKSKMGAGSTPAFAVLWLREISDEEEKTIKIDVWRGGKENLKKASTCADYNGLEDDEQPIGEIELTVKFWRGLNGYHKGFVQKSGYEDVRNVMVLNTVNDEIDDSDGGHEDNDSSSSDDDDDDYEHIHKSSQNISQTSASTDPIAKATEKRLKTHANQDSSASEPDSSSE